MNSLRKYIVYGIIALVLAVLFFSLFKSKSSGTQAPVIEAALLNGNEFSLEDLEGNYVVLSFWGSWCGPCLKENPRLVKLYKDFHTADYKDADGMEVVSIALEKSAKRTPALIEKYGLVWPYHIIEESRFVMSAPLALKYNVTEVPTKYLIDPDGIIVGKMTLEEMDSYLRDKLK